MFSIHCICRFNVFGETRKQEASILETFVPKVIGTFSKDGRKTVIETDVQYLVAMDGLESFSHFNVSSWFHKNDCREGRAILKVQSCKKTENPLTGIFATHSLMLPNLVGMACCQMTELDKKKLVFVDEIDAIDGNPLLDLKCHVPPEDRMGEVVVPEWIWKKKT